MGLGKVGAVVTALLISTGCSTTAMKLEDPTARRLEYAYQFTHAIDAMQTRAIAMDPGCYYEDYPLTKHIIGKHPSEKGVAAWAVGYAFLHAWISKKLEPKPKWQRAWQVTSLGLSVRNIVHNHNIGLRIDGDNVPCGE